MVEEIGQFLLPNQRMDVRAVALAQVLGLCSIVVNDLYWSHVLV